ncbi:hypothetical protein [Yersinia sp. 2466 StPb PI]|uniref:hypothetical protein n=1 Tax=Yersinia sp. 2466 StPb PI TaxID=3061648 RepID=UPI00355BF703
MAKVIKQKVYVDFTDDTETEVASVFPEHQSSEYFHHLGEVEENDERYLIFLSKLQR